MKHYALIVAGGSGMRMQTATPKQFLMLAGKPVLMRTIEQFADCMIVLVLPEQHVSYWQMLCKKYDFLAQVEIIYGGATRSESVYRGLQAVPDNALVAIHDGVRPLVSRQMIERGFLLAEKKGNAVPVVQLTDSIRLLTADGSRAVDRSSYCLVQTPQIFRAGEIKEAYRNCEADMMTDDASVMENTGRPLFLYEGEPSNIKITRPQDLAVAESLITNLP